MPYGVNGWGRVKEVEKPVQSINSFEIPVHKKQLKQVEIMYYSVTPGAHEPPKAAKERQTSIDMYYGLTRYSKTLYG